MESSTDHKGNFFSRLWAQSVERNRKKKARDRRTRQRLMGCCIRGDSTQDTNTPTNNQW